MSPTSLLLLFLFASAAVIPAAAKSTVISASGGAPTVYEVLESYNFPVGLLPHGVTGYDLDPETGKFSAYLNGTCSFSLEGSYQLRYQSTISGVISTNRLRNLRGISVKVLLFWINIIEVDRNGDNLEFSVGIASADFTVDNFYVQPKCGCGLDCLSLPGRGKEGAGMKLRGAF